MNPDIFDKVGTVLKNYPAVFGIFIILIGVVLFICALKDVQWIFGNTLSFNVRKVKGWVNLFGRGPARFIVGLMSLILVFIGIFWIYAA